jgi:hypothetical protein
MRSTLTKPHSFATDSIGKSACSSLQRAAFACTRSVNRAGVSPVSPRKSHAKLRGLMARRSTKVVRLDRHPRAPESRQLGLPPGRRRKTTVVWAMSSGTEIFFNRGKGRINPALIMRDAAAAKIAGINRCPRRTSGAIERTTPRGSGPCRRARHLWGECRPWPPGGKSFYLAPIPVLSG